MELRCCADYTWPADGASRVCSAGAAGALPVGSGAHVGAPLAQSAERLHGKEKVYGSIP
jgi:hypothetical protein